VSTVGAGRTARIGAFVSRLTAVLVGTLALVFGYLGLREYVGGDYPHGPLDLLYYDAQLFVLSSPPVDDAHRSFPLLLQLARFAAPAVTVYAFVEAGRRLFASELTRLRTRRSRSHVVVCGDSPVAYTLTGRLVRGRRRVVRVGAHDDADVRYRHPPWVQGDPANPEVLRTAGVPHARALYACTTDSAVNLAVALAVSAVPRRRRTTLEVHVQIDDPEFCLALQARRLGQPPSPRLAVNFFSAHELAARTLLAVQHPPAVVGRAPRLMIIGASWFGTALAVELARHWRLVDPHGREPLELTLVDTDAAAAVTRLHRRYPFLATTCRFTSRERDIGKLLDGDLPDEPPDRVYLCGDDEEVALKLALTMDHFWHRGPRSLVVRLTRLGLLDKAFHAPDEDRLLDDVSGTLHLFDAVRAGSDPHLVEDSLVERLGRGIHESYLADRLREGVRWNSSRAMRQWSELSEDLKANNRDQAADVGRKLRAIGCALAPSPIWGEPVALDDEAVEYLAQLEQQRWCVYLRRRGWRYGPRRDEAGHRHPDLVDWAELSESSREQNREAIRKMPGYLAEAGFQIVRLPEAGVPALSIVAPLPAR
jgi:voltage-gated potassium channel Kch